MMTPLDVIVIGTGVLACLGVLVVLVDVQTTPLDDEDDLDADACQCGDDQSGRCPACVADKRAWVERQRARQAKADAAQADEEPPF